MKGYKVFNPDWTCKGFQYEVGKTYGMDEDPICCERGFHFCEKASDCFNYYSFDPDNKVAEVEALGKVNTEGKKSCTNKIKIVREIPWEELLTIVNEGDGCTGLRNTGDCNTGDRNTGDRNTGDRNTGDRNTGNWNTGDCNTGNCNTGNCNTGNWNTGNCNTGNCNTGDWNSVSFSSGIFNTKESKILMFNKPSDWSYRDWLNSYARYLLNMIPKKVVEWIWSGDMTNEEKERHPEYETTGGYLKVLDESECAQVWWDGLSDDDKQAVMNIPNFDKDIFEEITGIKMDKEEGEE